MEVTSMQLCDDLFVLLGKLKVAMVATGDVHGLTPPQLHALYMIMHGESTMGRLATALHCDASNVTGIVDRLVARRLVTSEASPHDRRAKILKLSTHGQEVLQGFLNDLPNRLGCPRMSSAENAQLHALITKLTAA